MPEILVRRQSRREDLERYLPVKTLVLGAENHRHSAPADLLLQPIPGDPARARNRAGTRPLSGPSPPIAAPVTAIGTPGKQY